MSLRGLAARQARCPIPKGAVLKALSVGTLLLHPHPRLPARPIRHSSLYIIYRRQLPSVLRILAVT